MKFKGHPASHGAKSLYQILHQLLVVFSSVVAQEALDNCYETVPCCSLNPTIQYNWEIIGDFKMVAFLLGLQGGFIKFQCFLCIWDSRATSDHYNRKNWEQRTEFVVGTRNVMWEPLVDPRIALMPPLHIKLGLMKQFVKALNQESAAFKYLLEFFPKLSEAKNYQ